MLSLHLYVEKKVFASVKNWHKSTNSNVYGMASLFVRMYVRRCTQLGPPGLCMATGDKDLWSSILSRMYLHLHNTHNATDNDSSPLQRAKTDGTIKVSI